MTREASIIRLGILIFILSFSLASNAQQRVNLQFEYFGSENVKIVKGLSQNTINAITQDYNGYIWIGTWDGLNRYDGYNYKIYSIAEGLSNYTIKTLLADSSGNLWIGTEYGLNVLDITTGEIKQYFHNESDSCSLTNNWINSIYQDPYNQIWVSTASGLNKFNKEENCFERFLYQKSSAQSLKSSYLNQIIHDTLSYYWIASSYGLVHFDAESHSVDRYFAIPGNPNSLSSNEILCLVKDRTFNRLWVGTRNGLNRFDLFSKSFRTYSYQPGGTSTISANVISVLFIDHFGHLWIGTDGGGLNMYNDKKDNFLQIKSIPNETGALSNNSVSSIFQDNDNILWFGTFSGLNKLNANVNRFKLYQSNSTQMNSLSDNVVWSFLEDQPGVIWIGTSKGINIFHEEDERFEFIAYDPNNKNGIPDNTIRALYKDNKGYYWIGSQYKGLVRYDKPNNRFTGYRHNRKDSTSLSSNYVLDIIEDSKGRFWVGTTNGINLFDIKTGKSKRMFTHLPDSLQIGDCSVFEIVEDSRQNVWFPTYSGLLKLDHESNKFIRYTHDPEDPNSLPTNKVFCVFEDHWGYIWIATRGSGICRMNPETGDIKTYTTEDGLPHNVTYAILEDKRGILWISTNKGLSKFLPETETFINYDVQDGLGSNEFNTNAKLKTSTGEMFFGGMGGVNSFYPDQIKINTSIPPLVITEFNKFNVPQQQSFMDGDTIFLSHNDNFFSLEFAALDFTNPNKNKYQYKLEKYDEEWINRDSDRRRAEYTKVQPGTYTFKVKGSNNDGIWNEKGISLTIIITPPWYNTWLFRILMIILIVTGTWVFIYRRLKRIKRKHEMERRVLEIEKQMFEVEQQALRLQMNPHFIFNSLNSIQSFVINNDTDFAIKYLAKFSQLMRLILAHSGESTIPLKDELTALSYYMDIERLRFDNKFDYTITLDPSIDEEFLEIPPMIFQPYVENAIIHGLINSKTGGHISISFKKQANLLFCSIEDNGVGREKANEIRENSGLKRKPRGMLITKKRLEMLNEKNNEEFSVRILDLNDDHGKPAGTRVELLVSYIEE